MKPAVLAVLFSALIAVAGCAGGTSANPQSLSPQGSAQVSVSPRHATRGRHRFIFSSDHYGNLHAARQRPF